MFVLLTLVFSTCASIKPLPPSAVTTERVEKKNYEIGKTQSCYVGDPMVRFKDYVIVKKPTAKVCASNDFTINGGHFAVSVNYSGMKEDTYPILGTVTKDGTINYVVQFPIRRDLLFLVSEKEDFTGTAVQSFGGGYIVYKYSVNPADTKFVRITQDSVEQKEGYTNYEIIYTGRTPDSIKFLYREYTPDDLAKAAFYQDLNYQADSKVIRFRNLRIKVEGADEEKIVYAVIED